MVAELVDADGDDEEDEEGGGEFIGNLAWFSCF